LTSTSKPDWKPRLLLKLEDLLGLGLGIITEGLGEGLGDGLGLGEGDGLGLGDNEGDGEGDGEMLRLGEKEGLGLTLGEGLGLGDSDGDGEGLKLELSEREGLAGLGDGETGETTPGLINPGLSVGDGTIGLENPGLGLIPKDEAPPV